MNNSRVGSDNKWAIGEMIKAEMADWPCIARDEAASGALERLVRFIAGLRKTTNPHIVDKACVNSKVTKHASSLPTGLKMTSNAEVFRYFGSPAEFHAQKSTRRQKVLKKKSRHVGGNPERPY